MDVFHVGASAPKAPESKNVEREPAQRAGTRPNPGEAPRDAFATSSDASVVASHVGTLSSTSEVRDDVIRSVSELLGKGLFDTADAAQRAAQGILDA